MQGAPLRLGWRHAGRRRGLPACPAAAETDEADLSTDFPSAILKVALRCSGAIAWTILLLAWGQLPGKAAAEGYTLLDASGDVMVRDEFAIAWRHPEEGELLPYRTLIFVPTGGHAHLRSAAASGADGHLGTLSITTTTALRLEPDLSRRLKVSQLELSATDQAALDEVKKQRAEASTQNLATTVLRDAWSRVVLVGKAKDHAKQEREATTPAGLPARDLNVDLRRDELIDLTSPARNVLLRPVALPIRINISWKSTALAPSEECEILLGQGGARPSVIARTRQPWFVLNLAEVGAYRVLVRTSDGRISSVARKIEVLPPATEEPSAPLAGPTDKKVFGISLKYPSDRHLLLGAKQKAALRFAWHRASGLGDPHYRLLILDEPSGKVAFEHVTSEQEATLDLVPGAYLWHVEATGLLQSNVRQLMHVASPPRRLRVAPPEGVSWVSLLQGGKDGAAPRTVHVEGWRTDEADVR